MPPHARYDLPTTVTLLPRLLGSIAACRAVVQGGAGDCCPRAPDAVASIIAEQEAAASIFDRRRQPSISPWAASRGSSIRSNASAGSAPSRHRGWMSRHGLRPGKILWCRRPTSPAWCEADARPAEYTELWKVAQRLTDRPPGSAPSARPPSPRCCGTSSTTTTRR